MLSLLFLAGAATAHFTVSYPASRGFDDDKIADYPCGGLNDVSAQRTSFPLSGGPIQIDNSHTRSLLQVNLAIGNGTFDHVVVPTFLEQGPGDFCFGNVAVANVQGLNISEGTNGTLQIIAGGSEHGLYACVDVTFTSQALSSSDFSSNCKNGSGQTVSQLQDPSVKANETTNLNLPTAAAGSSPTPASSSGGAASPSSSGAASVPTAVSWAVGALGVVGGLMVL